VPDASGEHGVVVLYVFGGRDASMRTNGADDAGRVCDELYRVEIVDDSALVTVISRMLMRACALVVLMMSCVLRF
jgi:hypothetical protein